MIPAEKHEEFARLWNDLTATQGYIRERLGVRYSDIEATRAFLGLPERPPVNRVAWEPNPEEIEQRSAECRSEWTRYGEGSRRTASSKQPFTVKSYTFDRRSMSFH